MRYCRRANRNLAALVIGLACMVLPLRATAADDPGAEAFLRHCMQCHTGILTGNDLQNTVLSTTESLDKTVRRMEQQHTAPLTEKQITDLVELLHDKEVRFRLEEAELMQDAPKISGSGADATGAQADVYAELFVRNCASCHTVGGGSSFGGDLAHTAKWSDAVLFEAVARMQTRVGQMSKDQMDGLVVLLKDDRRGGRLAAAGYRPHPAAKIARRLSPAEMASSAAKKRADVVRQKMTAAGKSGTQKQHPPYGILFVSLGLAAIAGLTCYKLIRKGGG